MLYIRSEKKRQYDIEWSRRRMQDPIKHARLLGQQKKYAESHREERNKYNRYYYAKNRDKLRKGQLKKYEDEKSEIFKAYGGKCICCGEDNPYFLVLDHVNNDGAKQRKQLGYSRQFFIWIIKNSFPPTIQILCANCNMGKARFGKCPHSL